MRPEDDRACTVDLETARGAAFHERLAVSWISNYRRGGFKRRLAFVRHLLAQVVRPGDRWLDAGCGAGLLTLEMSGLGAAGLAVDGSQQMIDAATREVGPLCSGFAFTRVASVDSIDVPESTFDGVLCSSVIEYMNAVDEALREFHRVLRSGGTLVLSVPNRHSVVRSGQKWLRKIGLRCGLDLCPYLGASVHDFTDQELLQHMRSAGFSARRLRISNSKTAGTAFIATRTAAPSD